MRAVLEEARKQIDFLDRVREKLSSGAYKSQPNPNPLAHSHVWETFHVVVDTVTGLLVGANICTRCRMLLSAINDGCTSTMNRHVRYRCAEGDAGNRKPPSPEAKNLARRAAAEACAEGMMSFESMTGDGMVRFAQTLVDIGARCGPKPVDAKQLMPCATSMSNYVRDEAARVREEVVPTVKAAMAENACAATVDTWTEEKTKQHFISFTVHFVDKEWVLQSEYLITIQFDEDETGKLFLFFE